MQSYLRYPRLPPADGIIRAARGVSAKPAEMCAMRTYDEFRVGESKSIIDEIDHVLAIYYGFTEEELDFVINYDIKYRMGHDAEDVDE